MFIKLCQPLSNVDNEADLSAYCKNISSKCATAEILHV